MAPGILTDSSGENGFHQPVENGKSQHREPLELSGALDGFKYEDTTPVIGREFSDVNIVDDIMSSEERMRDLAITSELQRKETGRTMLTLLGSRTTWRRLLPRPRQPHKRASKGPCEPHGLGQWKAEGLQPAYPSSPEHDQRIRSR